MYDTCISSTDRLHFMEKLTGTCSKSDQSLVVSDAAWSILSTWISPSWIYFLHSPIFVAYWPHGFYDYAVLHRTICLKIKCCWRIRCTDSIIYYLCTDVRVIHADCWCKRDTFILCILTKYRRLKSYLKLLCEFLDSFQRFIRIINVNNYWISD